MRILSVVMIAIALCAACSSSEPVDPAARADLEFDICEAVFRHQFEHNASAAQQGAAAYFLTLRKQDVSAEFLARFAGNGIPVRPGSEFEEGKGLQFRVDSIEWQDDGGVKVNGGYYEAGMSSSGNVYTLERDGEQWEVTDDKMEWIS